MKDHLPFDRLTISGIFYNPEQLKDMVTKRIGNRSLPEWERDFYEFLSEWLNPDVFISLSTSGSTGPPKKMRVAKSAMLQSAYNTLSFFSLKPGNTALLCLPCRYIAGKMMVVRALAGGLNLIPVPVDGRPLQTVLTPIDFVAMTPFQMGNELAVEPSRLSHLKTVILGGSPVSPEMVTSLQKQSFQAWETYGMTETLSHVALKPLNGPRSSDWFTPLPGVKAGSDSRECLTIEVPGITTGILKTNDLVTFNARGQFMIKGRFDHVINSGGIKIIPEEIEALIAHLLPCPFVISALSHPTLGRQPVLIVEKPIADPEALLKKIKKTLPPFHAPAHVLIRNPLPRTPNGKIKRHLLP